MPPAAAASTALGLALLLAALVTTVAGVDGTGELMDMNGERGMDGGAGWLAVMGGVACGAVWLVGAVVLYRRFARRG